MKKVILFTLMSIFALNLPGQVHWNKYPDNPVMLASPAGVWDEVLISPSTVLCQDSIYKMWYWGGDHAKHIFLIGYATSTDGIIWTKDELNNPVLTSGPEGSWDANTVNTPSVLFVDSVYHMWYTGYTDWPYTYRIGHATSTNGVDWIKDAVNNPVLDGGPAGSWDENGAGDVTVIHDGEQYHMWYVSNRNSSTKQNMGHATSPDGVNWTKDPLNPVMTPEENWENNRIDFPNVVFNGIDFHLWYSAGTSIGWGMGYATSTDGSKWIKDTRNPVFEGSQGTWDEKSILGYAVIDSAQIKYKMWYGGNDTFLDDSDIGYAESDTRIPYLSVTSKTILDPTDTLFAGIDLDGVIYIVPDGTAHVIDSIVKYMVASVDAPTQTEAEILLTDLSSGHYNVIAISSLGIVCTNPFFINLVPNAKPPILDVENDNVTQGDTIRVASDKDGTIYLVIEGTTPDNIFIHATRIKDSLQVTAGNQAGFPTLDLYPKVYLLYAIDAYGQFSEAFQVIVNPSDPTGINITNEGGIRIFPNPVYDQLTLQTREEGGSQIEISSINGQRIYSDVMEGSTLQIDLSSFRKGIYLITIRSKDIVKTNKLIKL